MGRAEADPNKREGHDLAANIRTGAPVALGRMSPVCVYGRMSPVAPPGAWAPVARGPARGLGACRPWPRQGGRLSPLGACRPWAHVAPGRMSPLGACRPWAHVARGRTSLLGACRPGARVALGPCRPWAHVTNTGARQLCHAPPAATPPAGRAVFFRPGSLSSAVRHLCHASLGNAHLGLRCLYWPHGLQQQRPPRSALLSTGPAAFPMR